MTPAELKTACEAVCNIVTKLIIKGVSAVFVAAPYIFALQQIYDCEFAVFELKNAKKRRIPPPLLL